MILHGWYSKFQDDKYGHAVVVTANGVVSKISYVANSSHRNVLAIKPDADDIYVGEIDNVIKHDWITR